MAGKSFTNCAILSITTVPICEADGGDLCEADDCELATARSRTPQLPPHVSEASHESKTFFFLAASLLKVKELQTPPESL